MVDNQRLYRTLGVPAHATAAQIKKAYHQLAKQHHPDRGGDKVKFQEISAAYEVLGNEWRRQEYDDYGEAALSEDAGSPSAAEAAAAQSFAQNFARSFSNGMAFQDFFGSHQPAAPQVAARVTATLHATLEEVYSGARKLVTYKRLVECCSCSGSGEKRGVGKLTCRHCQGHGFQVRSQTSRQGVTQQFRWFCQACEGKGKVLPVDAVCISCGGQGLRKVDSTLEVEVPRGAEDGQAMRYSGKGNQPPGQAAGDLIIVLSVAQHSRCRKFVRDGDSLVTTVTATLADSLLGKLCHLDHLDGRKLRLRPPEGKVLKPNSLWRVRRQGMPLLMRPDLRGDLFVQMHVAFPDHVDDVHQDLEQLVAGARRERADPQRLQWFRFPSWLASRLSSLTSGSAADSQQKDHSEAPSAAANSIFPMEEVEPHPSSGSSPGSRATAGARFSRL